MVLKVSTYLGQYLNTATDGNVFAEFSVLINRWRLVCRKCQVTRTYGNEYDLETSYEKEGVLDADIQNFAKEHRHAFKDPRVTPAPALTPRQEKVAIARRETGRKIRP
jgi:hypothetical protein